jgi:hypothetical protein
MARLQRGTRHADLRIFMPVMRKTLFRIRKNVLGRDRARVRTLWQPFT